MNIIFRIDAPYQWAKYDGNKVDSFGEVDSLSELPTSTDIDEHIGVIDGQCVSVHQVDVPAKSKKQMMIAAPYALEESLADDIDDLHFVLMDWEAGKSATVAVVARSKMQASLEAMREAGISLDRLLPETLLLPLHEASEHTLAVTGSGEFSGLLVRSRNQPSMVLDEDLLPRWLEEMVDGGLGIAVNSEELVQHILEKSPDVDARHWPIGDRMAYWLEHSPDLSANLLSNEFQPIENSNKQLNFRWAAIFVAVAIAFKFLFDGYQYVSLWNENRQIDQQMVSIIQQTFPQVSTVIPSKERFIVQQQMNLLQGNSNSLGEFQQIIAVLAEVSLKTGLQISDIRFRSGEMTLTCLLKDFAQVDILTNSLSAHPLITAVLSSSGSEGTQVSARYVLRRKT